MKIASDLKRFFFALIVSFNKSINRFPSSTSSIQRHIFAKYIFPSTCRIAFGWNHFFRKYVLTRYYRFVNAYTAARYLRTWSLLNNAADKTSVSTQNVFRKFPRNFQFPNVIINIVNSARFFVVFTCTSITLTVYRFTGLQSLSNRISSTQRRYVYSLFKFVLYTRYFVYITVYSILC